MKIFRPLRLAVLVVPMVLAAAGFALAPPRTVGVASAVVNQVTIRSTGQPRAHPVAVRQNVALADQVQTGAASRLQLTLLDRSVFTVGANATLTIDRFVYDPAGSSMSATLARGALRFLSGGIAHRPGTAINTPSASIGIRGTILDTVAGPEAMKIAKGECGIGSETVADPDTAVLVVLRGPGPRRQGQAPVGLLEITAAGRTVTLDRPLLAAYIPRRGAAPIGPFTISAAGLERLSRLILPALARAQPVSDAPCPNQRQQQQQQQASGYDAPGGSAPGGSALSGSALGGGAPGPGLSGPLGSEAMTPLGGQQATQLAQTQSQQPGAQTPGSTGAVRPRPNRFFSEALAGTAGLFGVLAAAGAFDHHHPVSP